MVTLIEGRAKRIQVDIIDGKFAANKTIDPSVFESIETDLLIDFHLMTENPVDWMERSVRGMADRVIGQIEMMSDQREFVGKAEELGLKVGLAIDLDTPVSKLDPSVLNDLDVVLVMSVEAGFGGQGFDRRALEKIRELDEIRVRDATPFVICDDGGITFDNVDDVRIAGVDEVAIGRRLFDGNIEENIEKYMREAYHLT